MCNIISGDLPQQAAQVCNTGCSICPPMSESELHVHGARVLLTFTGPECD